MCIPFWCLLDREAHPTAIAHSYTLSEAKLKVLCGYKGYSSKEVTRCKEMKTELKVQVESSMLCHQSTSCGPDNLSIDPVSQVQQLTSLQTATQTHIEEVAFLPVTCIDTGKNELFDKGKQFIRDGYDIFSQVQSFGKLLYACSILVVFYLFFLIREGHNLQDSSKSPFLLAIAFLLLICSQQILKCPTIQNVLRFIEGESKYSMWDYVGNKCTFGFVFVVCRDLPDQESCFQDILSQFDGSWVDFIMHLNCMSKNPIEDIYKLTYPTGHTEKSSSPALVSSFSTPFPIKKQVPKYRQFSGSPPKKCSGSFGEHSLSNEGRREGTPPKGGEHHQKPPHNQSDNLFRPNRNKKGEDEDTKPSGNGYSRPQSPSKRGTYDTQGSTSMAVRSPMQETAKHVEVSTPTAFGVTDKQYDPGGTQFIPKEGAALSLSPSHSKDGGDSGYSSKLPSQLLMSLTANAAACSPRTEAPNEDICYEDTPPMVVSNGSTPLDDSTSCVATNESPPFDGTSHAIGLAVNHEESFCSSFNAFVECTYPTLQTDAVDGPPVAQFVDSKTALRPTMQLFASPYPVLHENFSLCDLSEH